MPKVYLMCGRICSGKSTHAAALRRQHRAVVLSVDEIMLALFGQDTGDIHDTYVARAERWLYEKSLEIIESGISVILDWGFWTKRERDEARAFYAAHGVAYEFHYIDISPAEWQRRLQKRNRAVLAQETSAYYVDAGLTEKFDALFEVPDRAEIDVWLEQEKE